MVSLVTIKNALFKKLQGDPGKSVYVDTLGDGGGKDSASIYFPSGFFSSPQDGVEGVKVDTGEFNIIVGTQNYKINITLDKGEAKIFSYDADGVVLASLKFDKNGKNIFNDGTKLAARKEDAIQSTPTEDSAFWSWVTNVSAFINGLAPGTIPVVPQSLTGKITEGSDKVLLP